jgi:hypothetical protein
VNGSQINDLRRSARGARVAEPVRVAASGGPHPGDDESMTNPKIDNRKRFTRTLTDADLALTKIAGGAIITKPPVLGEGGTDWTRTGYGELTPSYDPRDCD